MQGAHTATDPAHAATRLHFQQDCAGYRSRTHCMVHGRSNNAGYRSCTHCRVREDRRKQPGRHMRRCIESGGAVKATGTPAVCRLFRCMMRLVLSAARLKFLVFRASASDFCSSYSWVTSCSPAPSPCIISIFRQHDDRCRRGDVSERKRTLAAGARCLLWGLRWGGYAAAGRSFQRSHCRWPANTSLKMRHLLKARFASRRQLRTQCAGTSGSGQQRPPHLLGASAELSVGASQSRLRPCQTLWCGRLGMDLSQGDLLFIRAAPREGELRHLDSDGVRNKSDSCQKRFALPRCFRTCLPPQGPANGQHGGQVT